MGFAGVSLSNFLRRPCGCALAAAHMAQLCAALDGGDAFGAAKPEVLVMPAWERREFRYLVHTDQKSTTYDDIAMQLRRAVDLHSAVSTAGAWIALLLASRALQKPPCSAAVTRGDGTCPAVAVPAGQGGAGASQEAGQEGAGSGGADLWVAAEWHTATDTHVRKLPPYNSSATVHLCLRLAKGVLACWGRPLPGVRLDLPSKNPSAPAPVLPKEQGCALLYAALACARLALLPAVWGRERVPRRTRAQLRAWWETCLAAAQHPEALMAGEPEVPDYPEWTVQQPPFGAGPSADAAAAIEAGVLPCLTQLVDRVSAGIDSDAVWCPLTIFPGVTPCLADVLRFGPLGQLGGLLPAVGKWLRGAAGDLRTAVAAEGGVDKEASGEEVPVWWFTNLVRQAMVYTRTFLSVVSLRCVDAHAGSAAAGRAGPGAGQCPMVLSSFALAELLPALSVGVRLSGELVARVVAGESRAGERGGCGADDAAAGDDQVIELVELVAYGCRAAVTAMDCVMALLAKLCQEAAAEPLRGCDGGDGGCAAACGTTGGGGSPSCAGDSAPGAAWRQLLLRDVRLMELLAAGVALHRELSRAAAAGLLPPGMGHRPDLASLRNSLSGALLLAALTFPVEFRAAAEAAAGAEAGAEARAVGVAAENGGGAVASPHPCMSLAAVQALLEWEAAHGVKGPGQKGDEGLKAVVRVVGGWDPSPGEAWGLARGCCVMYGLDLAEVVEVVRGMPHPEEARAAVAAAAASAAGAPASGPA